MNAQTRDDPKNTRPRGTGSIALQWWRRLNSDKGRSRRASIARLRRARDTVDIMLEAEGVALIQALEGRGSLTRAAHLAGVLATVRVHVETPVARTLGRRNPNEPSSALMMETRFRRLIQSEETERLETMRRAVQLMDGKANIADLAVAMIHWGTHVKERWARIYYIGETKN